MAEQGTTPVRVLLLARPGEARQRLEAAIGEAGAALVAVVDPTDGDHAATLALAPAAVLVALEPAIEDSLEHFDALLSDPAVLVMFDEAEVAAQRDGWDAARWVRHLAAKLNGHEDVLPPGAGSDDAVHPAPGRLPEQDFDPASVDSDALADTALDLAADVPRAEGFEALQPEAGAGESNVAGLVSAEDMDWSSSSDAYDVSLADDPDLARLLAGTAATAEDPEAGVDPVAVDPLTLGDGLSLADDDAPIATREEGEPAVDPRSLGDGLSLADPESYGHGVLRGAVMVEAGLGGPDAVRQLLGGLGKDFPRTVLIRLQLDGGRYERLVQQMQRATALPVALAEAGGPAEPGTVYFLAPDMAVASDRARLVFAIAEGGALDHYASLAAGDSALVFLSGASVDRVDAAMALAGEGAMVLAQAPASCYDGTAVETLVARGAQAAEPGELAQLLLDRWP